MDERSFITEIRRIFALAPTERFEAMSALHCTIHAEYTWAVEEVTPERAGSVSSDGRLVSQVVGHIMEWERYTLFCLGQLLSGVKSRKLLWKNGYVDKAGEPYNFGTLDAFNAFQVEQQRNAPWAEIQSAAIGIADTLLNLLFSNSVISPALLEDTDTFRRSCTMDNVFPSRAAGSSGMSSLTTRQWSMPVIFTVLKNEVAIAPYFLYTYHIDVY